MNPVLKEILQTGYVKSVSGELIKLHSGISREGGEFLQEIISRVKPVVSLEIGLAYGVSTLFICDALEKTAATRHIVIDPNQFGGPWGDSWEGIGLNNLKRAGYENIIEFHNVPSHLALPQLEAQGIKIDFAFIDGFHTFDYALLDFFYIDRMLRIGGVVALDDAVFPSIRKVCRFIIANRAYSLFRLEGAPHALKTIWRVLKGRFFVTDVRLGLVSGNRYIAFRKEAHDTRSWDFHREF